MARTVQCIKLGKEAEGLDYAPYPGELGKRIWESVSKEAWAAWLKHQTMLVNETASTWPTPAPASTCAPDGKPLLWRRRRRSPGLRATRSLEFKACKPVQCRRLGLLDVGWAAQRSWTLLDTGFGSGNQFLNLWQHWRSHPRRPALLHCVGLLTANQAAALATLLGQAANPPQQALARTLAAHCYGLEPGFHRILLEEGQLSLTLCVGERSALLAQLELRADALLADAPLQGWDKWQLKALARCCQRGTQLYFSGPSPPALQLLGDAGFALATGTDTRTGSDTVGVHAVYQPHWQLRGRQRDALCEAAPAAGAPGRCAVIGAGIAGASVARALALRGWQVDVYDSAPHSAAGASGLPLGLVVPHHSADDSPRSRMSRGGTRLMLQHAGALLRAQHDWCASGVLELAVAESGLAAEEAELLSHTTPGVADKAQSSWARPMAWGSTPGLWHPFAAWIKPAMLVQGWLNHARIRFHGAAPVHGLQRAPLGEPVLGQPVQGEPVQPWQLVREDGSVLGQADIVVFANAHGSAALLQRLANSLPENFPWVADLQPKLQSLQALHGTLSLGPAAEQDKVPGAGPAAAPAAIFPPFPVNGHGSFVSGVPTAQGPHWYAGSTFRSDPALHADLAREHAANLRKLQALLPRAAQALAAQFASGQVQAWQGTRCVTHDRLPLVGPLEDSTAPTLWLCAGMGARGLSFSALCAELLVAELGGEPLPLESSLARALGTRRRRRAAKASAVAIALAPVPT